MTSRFDFRRAVVALLATATFGSQAFASSPQAWETFRRDVDAACRAAAAEEIVEPQVVVDPFGLQSYGLAFLSGTSPQGEPQSLVCIYDKAAGTVELGGTLALERVAPELAQAHMPERAATTLAAAPAAPERLLSPSAMAVSPELATLEAPAGSARGERCDAACAQTLDRLAASDRENLTDLAAQIKRTVDANEAASLSAGPAAIRQAALDAARAFDGEGDPMPALGAAMAGSGSCTLYYFGYQNEAARTVGTHRCRVSEGENGVLTVEKTSGEGLLGELRPLGGGVSAFVGRTFASGAEPVGYDAANPESDANAEFGNTVGFAAAHDGELLVISSQRRRFEDSDRFFWVLAIDPS